MRSMATKAAFVALAVAVLPLAGCGSNDTDSAQTSAPAASSAPAGNGVTALSPDEIVTKAKAALATAKSFHVKGDVAEDGQKTGIDLKLNGDDFIGAMTMGTAKVELLAVGGKKYMRPNDEFWTTAAGAQGKTVAQLVNGRWVAGADSDQSFADMFSIGNVNEMLKPTGALSKGDETQINGVPVIGLNDAGEPGSVLYVATTGEPFPIQMLGADKSTVDFTEFGETFTDIKAPATKDVVDLGKLGG
ncbi:hypothetical protein GCM10010435_87850 [Winogradskya consettensis]